MQPSELAMRLPFSDILRSVDLRYFAFKLDFLNILKQTYFENSHVSDDVARFRHCKKQRKYLRYWFFRCLYKTGEGRWQSFQLFLCKYSLFKSSQISSILMIVKKGNYWFRTVSNMNYISISLIDHSKTTHSARQGRKFV